MAAKTVTIKVDGKKKASSPKPKIVSGKVYAYAKSISKAMGAKYTYSSKKKLITIKKNGKSIKYTIGKKKVSVFGKKVTTSPAKLYKKKPYVAVKFLAGKLGYSYKYDKKKRIATLTKKETKPADEDKPVIVDGWLLKYHETFDESFNEPTNWTLDDYTNQDDRMYGDKGEYFLSTSGFEEKLNSFDAYRKSYTYGKNDWLTVQLYGRDNDKDGTVESGGKVLNSDGQAKVSIGTNTDGATIANTRALPDKYRIEVTVSNINFGGKEIVDGQETNSWEYNGKYNGYHTSDMSSAPWDFGTVTDENGIYFLCVVDYPDPKPHNNLFMHHHRKVCFDSDNNPAGWSSIWNPLTEKFESDGSRFITSLFLDGRSAGSPSSGNTFYYATQKGLRAGGVYAYDKYIPTEKYTFSIERTPEYYELSVSGKFVYGGQTTYSYRKMHNENFPVWHFNYNQKEKEDSGWTIKNQTITYNGYSEETWPEDAVYPDYFFFGEPHINYYEGDCCYDDLKLYIDPTSDWE